MKDTEPGLSRVLAPILDMYMDSAVGVVGCWSSGIHRKSCEVDVVIVSKSSRPSASVRIGGTYMDLFFLEENEVLGLTDPEHSVAIAHLKPVKDLSLVLSTASAASIAVMADSSKKSARARLAVSLKALGRADEAVSGGRVAEADFWTMAASYDFARALIHSKETMPSPSHLLAQMKEHAKGSGKSFEAFSFGAGLDRSSKESCGARLEGVGILHDLLHERVGEIKGQASGWNEARMAVVRGKAAELAVGMEHPECYGFLGQEVVGALLELSRAGESNGDAEFEKSDALGSILSGSQRLLGEKLVEDLGLGRQEERPGKVLAQLREQISRLARHL
ncbi:MAG: hypothetical protein HY297_02460 [Thaumarchaeota archaeon]|nr:hypothetical protein [Nitrososphaerota archaeon]